MKKYQAIFGKVKEVEVIRETAKMVVVSSNISGERKEAKTTDWYCYRDSFEEAKQWLVNKEMEEVNRIESQLRHANNMLQKALSITESK